MDKFSVGDTVKYFRPKGVSFLDIEEIHKCIVSEAGYERTENFAKNVKVVDVAVKEKNKSLIPLYKEKDYIYPDRFFGVKIEWLSHTRTVLTEKVHSGFM